MASGPIAIPKDFPLVGLALADMVLLNFWLQSRVGKARRELGVQYPNLYATDAEAKADHKKLVFNCVQRGHQNCLEYVPFVIGLTLFFGLYHPRLSSIFTHVWIVGRLGYAAGYATGIPKKRTNPIAILHYLGLVGLLVGSFTVAIPHVRAAFF